jgi:hypothetical protein
MPATEMIMVIAVAAAAALTLIHLFRLAAAAAMHRTIRRMIEKDPAVAEGLLAQLVTDSGSGSDDRTAVLLIGFGIAMVIASLIVGDPSWMHYAIAGAAFPLVLGTALWLRHMVSVRRQRAGRE